MQRNRGVRMRMLLRHRPERPWRRAMRGSVQNIGGTTGSVAIARTSCV